MLTKSELEIMELIWKSKDPLTSAQIIEMSTDRTWKKSYIHLLLTSLLEKGMIDIAGFIKTTKNYARTFKAKISREEYYVNKVTSLNNFEQSDIPVIISSIIKKNSDIVFIDEVKKVIDKRKSELKKQH